jgi:hypothetical protein
MSGGKSNEWGHFFYKFTKSDEISVKYEQKLQKFEILSGGACPH